VALAHTCASSILTSHVIDSSPKCSIMNHRHATLHMGLDCIRSLAQAEYIACAGSSPRIQIITKDTEVRIGFAYGINREARNLCTQTK
jgi:hypothetical protein